MLKIELENRIGFEISESEFNAANQQYMNCDLDKDDFAKAYKSYYFTLHPEKKAELKEAKRRAKMSNKEKLVEDITAICQSVSSNYPLSDFEIDIKKIFDNSDFDIYFLLRETGSELYLNEYETKHGNRNINHWKTSRKALYHIEANTNHYRINLIEEY